MFKGRNFTLFLTSVLIDLICVGITMFLFDPTTPMQVSCWCLLCAFVDSIILLYVYHKNKISKITIQNIKSYNVDYIIKLSNRVNSLIISLTSWFFLAIVFLLFAILKL